MRILSTFKPRTPHRPTPPAPHSIAASASATFISHRRVCRIRSMWGGVCSHICVCVYVACNFGCYECVIIYCFSRVHILLQTAITFCCARCAHTNTHTPRNWCASLVRAPLVAIFNAQIWRFSTGVHKLSRYIAHLLQLNCTHRPPGSAPTPRALTHIIFAANFRVAFMFIFVFGFFVFCFYVSLLRS